MVKFNKPDSVIWNATEQTSQFIEITVPQDYNVVSATANKITKILEPGKSYYCAGCDWCTWSVCESLTMYLADVSRDTPSRIVYKNALLGTAHI